MKKSIIFIIIGIIALVMFILLRPTEGNNILKDFDETVRVYSLGSCGCCGVHASYLQNLGLNVEQIKMNDLSAIKKQYGIPSELESCHTTIIGDYFVEGHIPKEAIEKLIREKPDIAGIALPGMPSGSPGMPGTKTGNWIIYAVNKDGTYREFMEI